MATTGLFSGLQKDVTCPICMDILKQPVSTNCGHNFCLECISHVGEASENISQCPLCKTSVNRPFQPNKLLESLMEKIQITGKKVSEVRYWRHNEKLLYFCEDDREFLCSLCCNSKDHRFHNVSLTKEAAQNYQKQIQVQPQDMGQKEKEVLEKKKQGEGTIATFKDQVHQKRIKSQEEFKCLRKNLEEEECFLLARQKNLKDEESFLQARWKNLGEEESFFMDNLHWLEQEGDKLKKQSKIVTTVQPNSSKKLPMSPRTKSKMPPGKLQQDPGDPSSRPQELPFAIPPPVPVDLEDKNKYTEKKTKGQKKKDKILSWHSLKAKMDSCLVTLNAESADPDLTLSQDLKTASLQPDPRGSGNKQAKSRPFEHYHWVLGSPGLSSGQVIWEVKLQETDKGECVVGVATELVPGQHCLKHIWALRVSDKEWQPITESSARQNIPVLLRKMGIQLDRDHGKVVFFNSATNEYIYTFQESFKGKVFPFFGLLNPGSKITLIP